MENCKLLNQVRKIFAHLICAFFFLQTSNAQTFNPLLATKLQNTLDSLVTLFAENTKGISSSVYVPGQGIWKGASGISHAGIPITTNMEFGIASNTKLFVAVTILKLAEDGILNLNDALNEWIPNYPNVNPNITIRQLLNHTSGVSDPFYTTGLLDTIQSHPTHVYTPTEILTWLGPPSFPPGTNYGYSNINYVLAGMVAQSATGIPIHQLIRNTILTPLQLDSIFYDVQEAEIGTLAHRWNNGTDIHTTSRISLNTAGGPAGSLFSVANQIAKWYNALMSNQILNQNSFNELTTFATPGNYGLGLQKYAIFGRDTWGHGGSTIGYKSRVFFDPCMKTVVCCLSNSDYSAVDGITALLYKVLFDNLPACAGNISGLTLVYPGQSSVTYTVPVITNASSYVWSLPNGASGSSSTNSIIVNFSLSATSGNITVKGSNSYGEGAISTFPVTVAFPQNCNIVMNTNDSGLGSLQYALYCVNENGSVYFNNTIEGDTILVGSQAISLTKSVNIINTNSQKVYIKGSSEYLITASNNKIIWIENLGLISDNPLRTTILNSGDLSLKNIDSSATYAGKSKFSNINNGQLKFYGTTQIK